MRIADAYSKIATPSAGTSGASATKQAERGKGQACHGSESHDNVKLTLSAQARELANSASTPTQNFDAAKVERLKSAMDAGSYHINAAVIAARIADGG